MAAVVTRIIVRDLDGTRAGHFTRETASRWDDRDPVTGNGAAGTGRGEAVLRTASGRWIHERWTDWGGEESAYAYITAGAAHEWLLDGGHDAAAAEYFGAVPEEEDRRGGRPEIGNRVNVFLGDLLPAVDAAALASGESRSGAVRRLLAAGLAAETGSTRRV